MIELKEINISFGKKECIRNGHFIAYPFQITSIIGESGTGKSSLLYLIGMLSSKKYKYYYNNELLELDEKQKFDFRDKHISFVTQNNLLIETISVEKNLEFYFQRSNGFYTVDELLDKINLTDKRKAMPRNLSGGERQRVAIACALAKNSDIILADEITSALDDSNKEIIMRLFREYANLGKTVILVTHENDVIEKSDRIYRLEHLELILEKDNEPNQEIIKEQIIKNKSSLLKNFEILFYSNRKYNWRRILISFIVMIMIFISASIFNHDYKKTNFGSFSTSDLTNVKLLVFSDETGFYHKNRDAFGYGMHQIIYQQPILPSIVEHLNEIEHIDKSYDYYTFEYSSLTENNEYNDMKIKVLRDDQEISKHEITDEDIVGSNSYSFSVLPYYDEDNFESDEGVYINTNIAYYYNIEIGDTLELELNVPYAMIKSKEVISGNQEITPNAYHSVTCLSEQVSYKAEVLGIIESNSSFNNEIYLPCNIMQEMIDEQISRYKNNEIKINYDTYEEYSTIEDLKPYAKAIFVDKEENVLKVQNDINKISDQIFAYNEYQNILDLESMNNQLISDTLKTALFGITVFVLGALIVEFLYLKKYKSIYMMLKLIGYNNQEKNKLFILHGLWQLLIAFCLSMLMYIFASIPLILATIRNQNYYDVLLDFPELYIIYVTYSKFSWQHFIFFACFLVIIISSVHCSIKIFYDKQNLVKWVRGK